MPRKGVPYGGADCSMCCRLKMKLEALWQRTSGCILKIRGVTPDGAGNFGLEAGQNVNISEVSNGLRISTTGGVSYYTSDDPQLDIDNDDLKISLIDVAKDSDLDSVKAAIGAALPASTPQVYIATIPQTDYLDVCLAQFVRIGPDKGLLSLSGHMRDISLPGDVWTLISIDTIMSAMGLTHKRPSAYGRVTGWWHYDDGDDHGDRYGSGTVCMVFPSGGLELGRFYSGTDIGHWEISNIGRDRYISVRDVYVEIQSDAQHTHTLSAPAVMPGPQHTFRMHQSDL